MTRDLSENEAPKSFIQMLAQIGDGEAEASLSLELFNLLAELREQAVSTQSERKGELTLKIKIVVDKGAKTMTADYDVGTKEPKPPRQGSMFFFTSGGNWALDNPRQQKLGLRALDAELVKLKEPAAQ